MAHCCKGNFCGYRRKTFKIPQKLTDGTHTHTLEIFKMKILSRQCENNETSEWSISFTKEAQCYCAKEALQTMWRLVKSPFNCRDHWKIDELRQEVATSQKILITPWSWDPSTSSSIISKTMWATHWDYNHAPPDHTTCCHFQLTRQHNHRHWPYCNISPTYLQPCLSSTSCYSCIKSYFYQ